MKQDRQIVEALKSALDKATAEAGTLHADFQKSRDAAVAEHGVEKVIGDADVFGAVEAKHRAYAEKAQEVEVLRDRWAKAVDMLGSSDLADLGMTKMSADEARDAIRAEAGVKKSLGEQFTAADVMIGADLLFGIERFKIVEPRPVFAAYLERCHARPALQRAIAIDAG